MFLRVQTLLKYSVSHFGHSSPKHIHFWYQLLECKNRTFFEILQKKFWNFNKIRKNDFCAKVRSKSPRGVLGLTFPQVHGQKRFPSFFKKFFFFWKKSKKIAFFWKKKFHFWKFLKIRFSLFYTRCSLKHLLGCRSRLEKKI